MSNPIFLRTGCLFEYLPKYSISTFIIRKNLLKLQYNYIDRIEDSFVLSMYNDSTDLKDIYVT